MLMTRRSEPFNGTALESVLESTSEGTVLDFSFSSKSADSN